MYTKIYVFFMVLSCFISPIFGNNRLRLIIQNEVCNEWKKTEIQKNLESLRDKQISHSEMEDLFREKSASLLLVKFSIVNNRLYTSYLCPHNDRIDYYVKALTTLCRTLPLPDVTFLISMHDSIGTEEKVPIFVMSKNKSLGKQILIPDFDAIAGSYQVLKNHDVTQYIYPWNRKHPQMMWRGSTVQRSLVEGIYYLMPDNLHLFPRVTLCQYSLEYPDLINARFTFYAQGGEHIPSLQQYRGKYLSFEKQIEYKYHILLDGNASPYSLSGWKYFINSLVFKPDSQMTQWYYDALVPYVHYVPVNANLDDLIEKINWAMLHDKEAELIAFNAWNFAVNSITIEHNIAYIYYLLLAYSQLNFVS